MHNRYLIVTTLVPAIFLPCMAIAIEPRPDLNDAALSSQELAIPEPLVFDLVRPLGSPKGELEMNIFANHIGNAKDFAWSPEFEYAFADGYALELELPFENSTLKEYKLGLQGTIGTLLNERMIHGWQAIGRRAQSRKVYSGDLLYINGLRLSDQWSVMNMVGFRKTEFNNQGEWVKLINTSLFYQHSSQLTLGVELNNEISQRHEWRYRLTPQLHYSFSHNKAIQIGGGPSRLTENRKAEWLLSTRFIYSF
jgi:hypothetical protein